MPVDVYAPNYIPPEIYDVLLTDIQEKDITHVGIDLEHTNLSNADEDGKFPVLGTFYGENHRLFVALTVKKRSLRIWVLFLLDIGSPHTFLCADTLESLGYIEHVPPSTQVEINGVTVPVSPSHGHFTNINLLGQNYMKAAQLQLCVDYLQGTVVLKKHNCITHTWIAKRSKGEEGEACEGVVEEVFGQT